MKKRRTSKKKLTARELQEIRRKCAWIAAGIALLVVVIISLRSCRTQIVEEKKLEEVAKIEETRFSEEVMQYQPLIKQYAAENGIEDEEIYLLAIMQVETGGQGEDVMQSSESLGLPRNSLQPEESIAQACSYYAQLIKMADDLGCDHDSVIQAYNFGADYLNFVSERGKKNTFELAAGFAATHCNWTSVPYTHEIAVKENGGWRYRYGNMFYYRVVNDVLFGTETGDEDTDQTSAL